jgi:hypothetical protein
VNEEAMTRVGSQRHKKNGDEYRDDGANGTEKLADSKFRVQLHLELKIMKTNKMQLYRLIYYSKAALHVSGVVFAHHQEHFTVFTASGSIHSSRCRLVTWMSWNAENARKIRMYKT